MYFKKDISEEKRLERFIMQKIIRIGKDNKQIVFTAILVFALALIYNTLTPYTTDDYAYMYSAVDGSRIVNLFQIFPSLWSDYMNIHGRIVPHFFLQLFLIGPKWIFNIANASMYVLLIWLMTNVTEKGKSNKGLLWIVILVTLWVFMPAYGQVFFWMSGSVNYSWCYVFALMYLKFYFNLFRNPNTTHNNKKLIGFCVYSFFFGAYSELVSFSVVFTSFLIICIVMYTEHSIKKYIKYIVPIVTAALGYLTMILSPAQSSRQGELALETVFKKLISIFEDYYLCSKTLLVAWSILLVLAVSFRIDKKRVIMSISLLTVSLLSVAMLSIASYAVARHYANSIVFLIAAVVVLSQALCEKEITKCVVYCMYVYVVVSNLLPLWEGTYDIYSTYKQQNEREAYICEQKENGNDEIVYVPIIRPLTKYSCKYDLIDLQVDDKEAWPNSAVAKYYEIEKIYGTE